MDKTQLMLLMTPVILFSLTIHEYSHGKIAYLLGDDTAKQLGRLTFNPLKHLDPLGVVVFYFMGFGWAKPVPVNWRNFADPHKDMMYVAIAGPLANVILAVICSFFLRILPPESNIFLVVLLCFGVYMNVALAIFNMLPVFPLDGSSVLKGLIPREIAAKLTNFDRFGGFLLLGIFLMDRFAGTGIFWFVLGRPIIYVVQFLTQEAFPMLQQVLMAAFS